VHLRGGGHFPTRAILDAMTQREPTDKDRLEELAAFTRRTGRRPARRSAAAAERRLARWVYEITSGRRPVDAFVRVHVEDQLADADEAQTVEPLRVRARQTPRESPRQRYQRRKGRSDGRLDEFAAFIRLTGHRPSAHLGDAAERSLAMWANSVRSGQNLITAEGWRRLDELFTATPTRAQARGRKPPEPGSTDYRLAELKDFVERTGRFPRHKKNLFLLPGEHELYLWASDVRRGTRAVRAGVAAEVRDLHSRLVGHVDRRPAAEPAPRPVTFDAYVQMLMDLAKTSPTPELLDRIERILAGRTADEPAPPPG
jgi:hypothetical protein